MTAIDINTTKDMENLINDIKAQIEAILADIDKTENKATLELEKLGKQYRKETVK